MQFSIKSPFINSREIVGGWKCLNEYVACQVISSKHFIENSALTSTAEFVFDRIISLGSIVRFYSQHTELVLLYFSISISVYFYMVFFSLHNNTPCIVAQFLVLFQSLNTLAALLLFGITGPRYWHQSFFGLRICWKKYGHTLHRFQCFYWTEWSTRNNCQSTRKRPLPPWHSDFERGQRLSRSFNFPFLRRPPQTPKPYQLPDHHKNGSHRSRPRSCITVRPTSDWSLPWLRHGQNVLVHFSF